MLAGRIAGAAFLSFLVLAGGVAPAASDSETTTGSSAPSVLRVSGLEIGLAGSYKVGYWTPVRMQVKGGREPIAVMVELVVPDGDGTPVRFVAAQTVDVAVGEQATATVYAKFGSMSTPPTVRLVDSQGQVVAERTWPAGLGGVAGRDSAPLPATDELVLTLGSPIELESDPRAAVQTHVAHLDDAAALPTRWYGYEGVDAVLITTGDPHAAESLEQHPAQAAALRQWVRLGGRLVICAGAAAPQVLAPSTPLATLVPGKFERTVPLRRTIPLEAYGDSTYRIDTGGALRITAARLVEVEGNIEASEGTRAGDLPLVIRAASGLGEVVFVAVDLDRPPLAGWAGRPDMLNRLLSRSTKIRDDEADEMLGAVTTLGYDDLSGQLRAALDQFDQVTLVPFWVIAALAVVYLVLIGPVDYWLVRRVLKRMEATWVTFTLIVILISLAAYGAAFWLKGRTLRVNQVELIDVDVAGGLVRGTYWASILSPRPDAYDLTLQPRANPIRSAPSESDTATATAPDQSPEVLLSWMGLPGKALGGMNVGGGGLAVFERPYEIVPELGRMDQVPIQVWSTKGVTARWQAHGRLPLEAELREEADQTLGGRIVNRLGFDLVDARLLYDRWAWPLGTLNDGQSVVVNEETSALMSKTLLTQQRILGQRDLVTRYDPRSSDVARITEIMMLHGMAGGSRYTQGLVNRYQGFCDLSDHLTLGRALLVARRTGNGSHLLRDGRPLAKDATHAWTFYRFVLPVDRSSRE